MLQAEFKSHRRRNKCSDSKRFVSKLDGLFALKEERTALKAVETLCCSYLTKLEVTNLVGLLECAEDSSNYLPSVFFSGPSQNKLFLASDQMDV